MQNISVTVECPVHRSFRVAQVAGMMDVPVEAKSSRSFSIQLPDLTDDWKILLITGPSGSGKSTVARKAFGQELFAGHDWPADRSILDGFPEHLAANEIIGALTSVGFGSPPAWLRPFRVLSNGEQFRANTAYALLMDRKVIAIDEFSSFLDRTVAKVACAAISKGIRSGKINRRLIAVTCHADVKEWLEPDYVADLATCELARGCLRRPDINIEIVPADRRAWARCFAVHHYLSAELHQSAKCYVAVWNGVVVGFIAMLHVFGFKNRYRVHRVVVLPDYQGLGIGSRLTEQVAGMFVRQGNRVSITSSHPGLIAHYNHSPLWRLMRVNKTGNSKQSGAARAGWARKASTGRAVVAFEFVGR